MGGCEARENAPSSEFDEQPAGPRRASLGPEGLAERLHCLNCPALVATCGPVDLKETSAYREKLEPTLLDEASGDGALYA